MPESFHEYLQSNLAKLKYFVQDGQVVGLDVKL